MLKEAKHTHELSDKAEERAERARAMLPDPIKDKDHMKQSIVDSVDAQIDGIDRDRVAELVEEKYEQLIETSDVSDHLAPLAEGDVRRKAREEAA